MDTIKRIDKFLDENHKSVFGLPPKTLFRVKKEFKVELILKYESLTTQGSYKRVSDEWEKINMIEGDFIFTSNDEAFFMVDKDNNYVRCRPDSLEGSSEEPDLRRFSEEQLEKIGPIEKLGHSVPFKSREEIFIGRSI